MAKVKILTGKYKGKYLEFVGVSNYFREHYVYCSIKDGLEKYATPTYYVIRSLTGKLIWYLIDNVDLNDTFEKLNPSSLKVEQRDRVLDIITIYFNNMFPREGTLQQNMMFVSTEKRRLNVIFHSDCVSLVEASHLNRYLYTFPISYVKAIIHDYKKS